MDIHLPRLLEGIEEVVRDGAPMSPAIARMEVQTFSPEKLTTIRSR